MGIVLASLSETLVNGNFVHFDKFDFFDGIEEKKGRFGIILKNDDPDAILFATMSASFKVSQDILDENTLANDDLPCIIHSSSRFKCFRYKQDDCVCHNDFLIPDTCYISLGHAPSIAKRSTNHINDVYFKKGNLKFKGKLTKDNHIQLLECVVKSNGITGKEKLYWELEISKLKQEILNEAEAERLRLAALAKPKVPKQKIKPVSASVFIKRFKK